MHSVTYQPKVFLLFPFAVWKWGVFGGRRSTSGLATISMLHERGAHDAPPNCSSSCSVISTSVSLWAFQPSAETSRWCVGVGEEGEEGRGRCVWGGEEGKGLFAPRLHEDRGLRSGGAMTLVWVRYGGVGTAAA